MRKIVQRENFGDENEVPFGLGYIKEIEKEPEAKKTKRQSLKVENETSGVEVKSDEVKSSEVKSNEDKSVEVKHEKVKNTRSNWKKRRMKMKVMAQIHPKRKNLTHINAKKLKRKTEK